MLNESLGLKQMIGNDMKTALITGYGSRCCYLAKNLLEKVIKFMVQHTTGIQICGRWNGITNDIEYVDVDIVGFANVRRMIDKTKLLMKC